MTFPSNDARREEAIDFAHEIAARLFEENVEALERIVRNLGVPRSRLLLQRTLDVLKSGGMSTNDRSRKRSAGGIFFKLAKWTCNEPERMRCGLVSQETAKQKPQPSSAVRLRPDRALQRNGEPAVIIRRHIKREEAAHDVR